MAGDGPWGKLMAERMVEPLERWNVYMSKRFGVDGAIRGGMIPG